MEVNPFEFLRIKPCIQLDLKELRTRYIQIQREAHPDLGFDGAQAELANKSYRLLQDFETRLECLLKFYGNWPPNPNQMDFEFLEFAMDLGTEMDALSSEDEEGKFRISAILSEQRKLIEAQIQDNNTLLEIIDGKRLSDMAIILLSDIYQKSKYLTRLEKNLRGESEL